MLENGLNQLVSGYLVSFDWVLVLGNQFKPA